MARQEAYNLDQQLLDRTRFLWGPSVLALLSTSSRIAGGTRDAANSSTEVPRVTGAPKMMLPAIVTATAANQAPIKRARGISFNMVLAFFQFVL